MNELELIRNQLRAERTRVTRVALACASPQATAAFRQSCVEYLVFVLTRFEERDQMLADQYRARSAPSDPTRRQLEEIMSRSGTSREALAKLEVALKDSGPTSNRHWSDFGGFFVGPWRTRRDALDALQEHNSRVADWRAVSFVDADSIMEERTRYARVEPDLSARAAELDGPIL